jgi:hypothetical protein
MANENYKPRAILAQKPVLSYKCLPIQAKLSFYVGALWGEGKRGNI